MVRLRTLTPLAGWPHGCEPQDYAPTSLIRDMETFCLQSFGLPGERWISRLERPSDLDRFYFRDADAFERFTERFG